LPTALSRFQSARTIIVFGAGQGTPHGSEQ